MGAFLVHIKPKGPFHLGSDIGYEETEEYIHSDTLFSAIVNSYGMIYDVNEILPDIPFRITSAFPYVNDVYFLPTPADFDLAKICESKENKEYKKIKFVSHDLFEAITNDKIDKSQIPLKETKESSKPKTIQERYLPSHKMLDEILKYYELKDINKLYFTRKTDTPRVTIDRCSMASDVYHYADVYYNKNVGLYFVMKVEKKEYENRLKAAIRLLGDEGIGGDRSSGKGLFEVSFSDEIKFNVEPSKNGMNVTLSLVYPKREEVKLLSNSVFELTSRRGWVYSLWHKTLRRKTVRMITEGSVLQNGICGDIVDVSPSENGKRISTHPVYRYGYAFCVRRRLNEK